jgi:hypothetical protein
VQIATGFTHVSTGGEIAAPGSAELGNAAKFGGV